MNVKKKWQRFWTLDRHHDGGFTLVELIIVIAILAILAGVAVPAYNGYIKKAGTAADQQIIAAVNDAFAAACMESKIDVENVTSAKISLWEQKVNGLSDAVAPEVGTSAALDDSNFADVAAAFLKYYAGNESAVFKTENTNSLEWDQDETTFKMSNSFANMVLTLSDGTTLNLTAAALNAIIGSTYDTMGATSLLDMLGNNIEAAKSIFSLSTGGLGSIAGALGNIIGNNSLDIKGKVINSLKPGGSFYDLIPAEQRDAILAQFNTSAPNRLDSKYWFNSNQYDKDKAAYDAAQEKANSQLANAAALYVGNAFEENKVTGTQYYLALKGSTDPVGDVGKLADSTGGMGEMLINASISAATQEGFVNSTGKEGYATYVAENPGKTANDYVQTEAGKAAYAAYLQSPTCEKDLNAFVGAMTTVNSNVDSIGRKDYIEQGITNDKLQEMMETLIGN